MRKTAWLGMVASLAGTFAGAALAQRGAAGGHAGVSTGAAAPAARAGSYAVRPGSSPRVAAPATPVPGVTMTPNTYGSVSGFGNVVFPGAGHAPGAYSPFSIVDPNFGTRLSGTVGGFGNGGNGFRSGFRRYPQGGNTVVIPYAVPYAVPVYPPYYESYPPEAQQQPTVPSTIIYIVPGGQPPPPQSPPGAGIVTYVVPPHEAGATESVTPPEAQRLYLIALKNGSIYLANAYWVENGTLHYLTNSGAHNQVSFDQLDLEFTTRLNRERGLDFHLDQQQ